MCITVSVWWQLMIINCVFIIHCGFFIALCFLTCGVRCTVLFVHVIRGRLHISGELPLFNVPVVWNRGKMCYMVTCLKYVIYHIACDITSNLKVGQGTYRKFSQLLHHSLNWTVVSIQMWIVFHEKNMKGWGIKLRNCLHRCCDQFVIL